MNIFQSNDASKFTNHSCQEYSDARLSCNNDVFSPFLFILRETLRCQGTERGYQAVSYTPLTMGLLPLLLPCATTKMARSLFKAQRRPKCCHSLSRVAQRTFRPRHGRREVMSMFKTVEQRSPRRSAAHRLLTGGRGVGGTVVNILYQFERCFCLPSTTIVPLWPTMGDHGNPWATIAMILPPLCLLCKTCCGITAVLMVQGRHKGLLQ